MTNSVEEIGSFAFLYCTSLFSITLSNKITILSNHVFENSGISSIVIGKSINCIENNAFGSCNNLKSVIFEDPNNWVYNGESINVNDSELNAYLLSKAYTDGQWYKH